MLAELDPRFGQADRIRRSEQIPGCRRTLVLLP